MSAPNPPSDWRRLFRMACSLIDQVNTGQRVIESWTFGGGTAMMIQIGHRESHDVDIFLDDPQSLAFLNPERSDLAFEVLPAAYHGDGSTFQKFAFPGIGEIDFIVGRAMTPCPTITHNIDGRTVLLDSIAEIIAKKVHYRGASITPRDIFDIAAGAERHEREIVAALKTYQAEARTALAAVEKLSPAYVTGAIAALMIKDDFRPLAETALNRAKDILRLV
jgi:hypothetical protein